MSSAAFKYYPGHSRPVHDTRNPVYLSNEQKEAFNNTPQRFKYASHIPCSHPVVPDGTQIDFEFSDTTEVFLIIRPSDRVSTSDVLEYEDLMHQWFQKLSNYSRYCTDSIKNRGYLDL